MATVLVFCVLVFSVVGVVYSAVHLLMSGLSRLARRSQLVIRFRSNVRNTLRERCVEDLRAGIPYHWRIHEAFGVSYTRMLFSRKKLDPKNFYKNTKFLEPTNSKSERVPMYLLMAYIGGQWGIAGFEPHEECAVNFIAAVDSEFGEGAAFVCKLPDKSGHDSIADVQKHVDLAGLLSNLERGEVDFDAALAELHDPNKNEE